VLLAAGTTVDRRVLQARRGSVLVLVVGVLALMGIIVLVYATVGQGDRRSAAALVETRKLEDQSQAIGNYLASVVADSAVATVTQRVIADDRPGLSGPLGIDRYVDRVYRRTWTMPGVDPEVRSTVLDPARPANEQPWRVFTPTGAIVGAWPIDQNLLGGNPGGTPPALGVFTDPRIGLDPWLASTEMSWINLEGANLDTGGNGPWGDRHLDKRDWRAISNFAPDGRAVNLALLRGNFNLAPGVSPTRPAATQPLSFRSSDYLTIERLRPAAGSSRAARLNPGNWVPSQNLPGADPNPSVGEPISFNATNYWFRPADFFTNQVGVHRVGPDRRYPAGDVRNADNQWADADGDGVPDARWTELVDASDPNVLRSVLPTSSNVRFFVAARAIDLSGLINLNTALSFDQPPTRSAAAGATPADIDLRRLLRFGHVYTDGAAGTLALPGYDQYPQPAVTSAATYTDYNRSRADEIGSSAFGALLLTRINGFALGPGAFTPQTGYVTELSQPLLGTTQRLVAAARKDLYNAIGRNPLGASLTPDFSVTGPGNTAANRVTFASPFGIADELDLRVYQGLNDDSAVSRLEMTLDARNQTSPAFGPLRSNRSAEVERGSSRVAEDALLQSATSLRGLVTTVNAQRPLTTDVASPLASVGTATLTDGQRPEQQFRQVTSAPPALSGSEVRPDLNTLLNTMAPEADDDDRNVAAFSLFQGIVGGLAPDLGIRSSLNSAFSLSDSSTWSWSWNPQARRLQVLHYGSRTPRLPGEPVAGNTGANNSFLGNSAEFALRTSAHLFANLVDGRDLSDRPSRVTVLLSEPFRSLGRSRNFDFNNDGVPDFEAWVDANPVRQNGQVITQIPNVREATAPSQPRLSTVVDVGDEKLLPEPQWSPRTPPAINVYGVKPQPFLTAAVTFTLYGDDPNSAQGGDRQVKINGTISEGNSDFLCQVVAFQLHNPFDRPIALSQPAAAPGAATNREFGDATPVEGGTIGLGANNALSDLAYYIEFAGKFYALVEERRSGAGGGSGYEARRLVLNAGETRWFYVAAQDPADIVERWRRVAGPGGVTGTQDDQTNTGPFTDFINRQLSMNPVTLNPPAGAFPTRDPVRLMRIQPVSMQRYPGTGIAGLATDQFGPAENVPENQYFALFGGQSQAWINSDTEQPGPTNRAVRLWRFNQAQGESLSGVANSVNVLTNDMLVDVLRDPAAPPSPGVPASDEVRHISLNPRLENGETEIELESDENYPDFSQGVSLLLWSMINRAPDPRGADVPVGVMPAYLMEVKSSARDTEAGGTTERRQIVDSLNEWRTSPLRDATNGRANNDFNSGRTDRNITWNTVQLRQADFPSPAANGAGRTLGALLNSLRNNRVSTVLGQQPWQREPRNNPTPRFLNNLSGVPLADITDNVDRYVEMNLARPTPSNLPPPPLRPTDLLTTLAIGPYEVPVQPDPSGGTPLPDRNPDQRFTTLSEAAALVTDFDSPASREDAYWRVAGTVLSQSQPSQVLQPQFVRGRLRTDISVPFNDSNGNGRFDQFGRNADPHRGHGVPLALNLLSQFRTSGYGSLTVGEQGRVNLNTAPWAVLAMLPMATPDPDGWLPQTRLVRDFPGATSVSEALYAPADEVWDIASTIMAYRDRGLAWSRPASNVNGGRPFPIDFRDDNIEVVVRDVDSNWGRYDQKGRRWATGIPGIRQAPGFQSPGEVLLARLADAPQSLGTPAAASGQPVASTFASASAMPLAQRVFLSIDRLGRDGFPLDPAIEPAFVDGSVPASRVPDLRAGEPVGLLSNSSLARGWNARQDDTTQPTHGPFGSRTVDGSEEQLAIANSILGVSGVRSDVFAVWYLVHGYTPSDVEGLAPLIPNNVGDVVLQASLDDPTVSTPMVPSIRRRFLMILDRSEVTQVGQKPRVLLMQEVPVN
jgi:hypothetical protein